MKKNVALVYVSVLLVIFILVPLFVIKRTHDLKSGWNGLTWGNTEEQIRDWVKKNNSNYVFSKCENSHYGVMCFKLSWKTDDSPYEYIEFQFQDGKLCAVIETGKTCASDPAIKYDLGQSEGGTDLKFSMMKEKGIKYEYCDRAFYYSKDSKWSMTKTRYAVSRLVRNVPANAEIPDEIVKYRLTTAYYSSIYYDEIKNTDDSFPTARFF